MTNNEFINQLKKGDGWLIEIDIKTEAKRMLHQLIELYSNEKNKKTRMYLETIMYNLINILGVDDNETNNL